MWIIENEGEALDHKKLWLRPGKRYLFGRTVAEPGQLAIRGPGAEKVSRKHLTITVDAVEEGDAEVIEKRSTITIQDLGSKGGIKVNGHKYRNESCTLSEDSNVLQMGSFPPLFRITWFPVVLSFSFTSNQLRANPFARLRLSLEQLDIKLLSEYRIQITTHVISKKRNTPKGLQALINGKYIVNDGFIDAIVNAASLGQGEDESAMCPLEKDFDASWPDAMEFLPPPGEEPVPRLPETFAPNPERAHIFEGYTFIFYEKRQYESLLGPITNGKGKALLNEVVAGETQIDDFVRYVKGVAGEKGLGEFQDGNEGKGVVVVKWMPNSAEDVEWFAEFFRSISLRLDHRLIDQKDFLDAILNNDASSLRRSLEFESPPPTGQQSMEVDSVVEPVSQPQASFARKIKREPVKSRFRGFAVALSDDEDQQDEAPSLATGTNGLTTTNIGSSQEGLFVPEDDIEEDSTPAPLPSHQAQRKRPASPPANNEDIMADFAPTAAQVKRRRIAAGEEPVPRPRDPTPPIEKPTVIKRLPKPKKEIDILEVARRNKEEAENRAKEEQENLEADLEDLDLAEIRRLHIEEPMPLREAPQARTRDQDIAAGRWDPAWNGRKNFKRFRQRGAIQGRPPEKIIVPLEEVKSKAFGIGEDYWLEDSTDPRSKTQDNRSESHTLGQSHASVSFRESTNAASHTSKGRRRDTSEDEDAAVEIEDDDDEDEEFSTPFSSRVNRSTTIPSRPQSRSQQSVLNFDNTQGTRRTGKRPAQTPPVRDNPPKRAKAIVVDSEGEESDDDELQFRFGKR